MPNKDDIAPNDNNQLGTAVRTLVLGFFAIILAVVSVSFAIHHMRSGFESEYIDIYENQLRSIAMNAVLTINGDEIQADPISAGQKYPAIINLMLPNLSEDSFSTIDYGLFTLPEENTLTIICMSNAENLVSPNIQTYKWNSKKEPYPVNSENKTSLLIPILNSQGAVIGLFELTGTHNKLHEYGDILEGKLLLAVIVSAIVGVLLFSVQYFIPKLLFLRKREEAED